MFTQEELHALRQAAEHAWGDDTRHPAHQGNPLRCAGQCYVVSRWVQSLHGGHVARKDGHYIWLSPDKSTALDLTGDAHVYPNAPEGHPQAAEGSLWRPGPVLFKKATHPLFAGAEVVPEAKSHGRTALFVRRANRALDALTQGRKLSIDFAGDAFPAEEPQYVNDHGTGFLHDDPFSTPEAKTYNVVYANGELHLSADDSHDDLARHALIEPSHAGPFAAGFVTVDHVGRATWQLRSNVGLGALQRILKEYGKTVGWDWGGLTDATGQPISDEFAPKKSERLYYNLVAHQERLVLASDPFILATRESSDSELSTAGSRHGKIEIEGDLAKVSGLVDEPWMFEAFKEWADDRGLRLMAGDNVIRRIEDLDQENLWSPTNNDPEGTQFFHERKRDERSPGGVFKCPECARIFPSWHLYIMHRQEEEPVADSSPDVDPETSIDPLPDMDKPIPPNFTEMERGNSPTMGKVAVIRRSPDEWNAYMGGFKVGTLVVRRGVIRSIEAPNTHVADALLNRVQRAHDSLSFARFLSKWDDPEVGLLTRMGFYRVSASLLKWSKEPDPSKELEGPVPFIYDVDKDEIHTGAPGGRHSDIIGKFTPAGIVEGTYEPGGKVIIRSITNMPYTVRHMLELWYYTHPHLVIKSVHLRDDAGQDTKLASTTKRSAQEVGQYIANLVATDDVAWRAYKALADEGGKVYAVGGCVRDALLGKDPKDIDLMVTGLPAERVHEILKRLPGRVDLTGKDFGVFRYKDGEKGEVEIALPRRERSTGAGHQDFDVQADHTMTPQEDFYRRDFTANAMGVDLDTGKLVDPFGGADDVGAGRLRTLSDESLRDDPLRVVRGLVLRGRHGLEPDEDTRRQLGMAADGITHLPSERVQAELDKLFASKEPAEAIRLAHETGVLKHILPEVDAAFGYNQDNPHHEQELGEHLLSVLRHTAQMSDDPDLRLAALLHDIGKPASRWNECVHCTQQHGAKAVRPLDHKQCLHCGEPVSGHYYAYHVPNENGSTTVHGAQHEDVGAEMARERLEALKYPSKRIARVGELISHHMYTPFTTEKGARKFLNRVGDHADDLMLFRMADQGGKAAYDTDPTDNFNVERERALVNQVRDKGEATSQANLAVNGHDILQHLGIKPGPQVGQILQGLTDAVIEDPTLNERDALLQRAQELAA